MPFPDFPDNCIRGIPNHNCLLDDKATAYLTLFDFPGDRPRQDGWIEESINWMDDQHAIDFTLRQTKDDGRSLQFNVGVAVLSRSELNKIRRRHTDFFGYERARTEDNVYHGNLLLKADIRKERKTMIRAKLADISEIHLRENVQATQQ
jgi:hypothetical protein